MPSPIIYSGSETILRAGAFYTLLELTLTFKAELIDYIDYYNNRRIKARRKGLPPALHRQQALLAAWTIWVRNICLTFWGHFTRCCVVHKVLISNFWAFFQGWISGCEMVSLRGCERVSQNSWHYSHSLRSTFPGFLFPLGYGGLKRVLACKFVFFSVFPQFSKLWVSNWYHSLVSFRLKNRLGKSDYSFQKSDTWTRIHWSVALRLKVTRRSCSSRSIFIVAQNKWLCNDENDPYTSTEWEAPFIRVVSKKFLGAL